MNIPSLQDVLPARTRRILYALYAILSLASLTLGSLLVYTGRLDQGLLDEINQAIVILGVAIGYVAHDNTPKPTSDDLE